MIKQVESVGLSSTTKCLVCNAHPITRVDFTDGSVGKSNVNGWWISKFRGGGLVNIRLKYKTCRACGWYCNAVMEDE